VFSIACPVAETEALLRIGRAAQKLSPEVLVFFSPPLLKFAAFCSVKGADLRPLLKGRMEEQEGRGGGGASFFQGLFSSTERLDAFLVSLPEEVAL
jgi:hypothetical protein